jgi:hypothetical protein
LVTARTPVIGAPEPPAPATTLAALARTAPPVVSAAHPWSQQPGESEAAHSAFMGWLLQGTTRGAPAREHGAAAAAWDWAGRALAYDREQSTPAAIVPAGASPEARIMANLTRLVDIETQKLADQAASTPGTLVPLKDLTATVRVLQEMHEAGRAASSDASKPDLSKLTAEELRTWLQLNRKLQGQNRQ